MLQRFFQRYTGYLRSLKISYIINNWMNARHLQHNKSLYRKFGLRKSIFSPIGYADFEKQGHADDTPWLDRPDALQALEKHPDFKRFDVVLQGKCRQFVQEGFMVLENFYPAAVTNQLNMDVDDLLATGKAGYNFTGRKIFNLWEISPLADGTFFRNPDMLEILSFLMGKKAVPFQSLNFTLGSEQRAHSDSIHMTTEPPGYLLATWAALENIEAGSGPLVYYPGSHRLPFISTDDYPSGKGVFTLGNDSNKHYEEKIAEVIAAHQLQPHVFLPKRGDVLIWHANLLHGGSPITRPGATRRSMVCHYYAEDVICYHEMSQRPALLKSVPHR
jgi:ectoine hydroxylase